MISAGRDRKFGVRFRELNRYSPPASLPPNVGTFDGKPSYSSAEAPWTLSGYGLTNFPDPWYPRITSVFELRMGEAVSGFVYDVENGVLVNAADARDNVSNFDGTGVSL